MAKAEVFSLAFKLLKEESNCKLATKSFPQVSERELPLPKKFTVLFTQRPNKYAICVGIWQHIFTMSTIEEKRDKDIVSTTKH